MRRLPLLAVVVAGCGGDKLDLRTPGVKPKPAHAVPSPTPSPRPVTREEEAVIRGWADALRHGHVAAAARYFALPVVVANDAAPMRLTTRKDVRFFNETLPCGAKLVSTERAEHDYVVATFRLTERPGGAGCGNGAGALARTAFLIRHHHITQWVRVPDEAPATGSTS